MMRAHASAMVCGGRSRNSFSKALVKQLMEKARTRTGLSVVVDILDRVYAKGRKVVKEVRQAVNIVRDELLPLWNYRHPPGPRKKCRL